MSKEAVLATITFSVDELCNVVSRLETVTSKQLIDALDADKDEMHPNTYDLVSVLNLIQSHYDKMNEDIENLSV